MSSVWCTQVSCICSYCRVVSVPFSTAQLAHSTPFMVCVQIYLGNLTLLHEYAIGYCQTFDSAMSHLCFIILQTFDSEMGCVSLISPRPMPLLGPFSLKAGAVVQR